MEWKLGTMSLLSHLQFGGPKDPSGSDYTPKHSNWSMDGPQGKHRSGKKSKGSMFSRPQHAKGASGYTGKHSNAENMY